MLGQLNRTRNLSIRNALCAAAAALTLHACATAPAPQLTADALLMEPLRLADGKPFDVDAFFGALPDALTVTYADAAFNPEFGAMVVSDLAFSFAGPDGPGLHVDRATIWSADTEAMERVLSGAGDLQAMAPLFERIALDGVRSQGMQWEAGSESVSFSMARLVIDGLSARSFALAPKERDAEGLGILRTAAAVMNSFAYDGAVYTDLLLQIADSDANNVILEVEEGFARGYRAGAVDYQSTRLLNLLIQGRKGGPLVEVAARKKDADAAPSKALAKILNKPSNEEINGFIRKPAALLASAAAGGVKEYAIGFMDVRGADLSGALSWLAKWELPPITETNLMDFGSQTMTGYSESWNGRAVQTIDSAAIRADFYWLVPSNYQVAYSGFSQDIAGMIAEAQNELPPGAATETSPQFAKVQSALSSLGVDRLAGDMAISWAWNGETGAAALAGASDLTDVMASALNLNLAGPSLAEWDSLVRNGGAEAAVSNVALSALNFAITDQGILDRAFAYAAEQQGGGSGPEMRQAMSVMARLSGAQAAEANPRIPGYANAIADFLAGGGTISIVAAPAAPVSLMELEGIGKTAPQTIPDVLNLSITHEE